MREIKFRFWSSAENKYVQDTDYCYMDEDGKVSEFITSYESYLYRRLDIEIEQYTGLKDKNGKEIYEGDILSDGIKRAVVKYGEFNLKGLIKSVGFFGEVTNSMTHDIVIISKGRIIGNIHENPDLLPEARNETTKI